MFYFPQICQTVICILYPAATLIINPVTPSTINSITGKFLPKTSDNLMKAVPSYQYGNQEILPQMFFSPIVSAMSSGSYAQTFLNRLALQNPTVNATLGLAILKNSDEEIIPAVIPTKIYGEGTESKFPPFFEGLLQRVQSFFSIYKYPDLSRPGNSLVVTRPTRQSLTQITTIVSVHNADPIDEDYNEILLPETEPTNAQQENDIIKVGEDDEPGLELRLNS